MSKLREALDLIEENDPNVQRSSSVSRKVLAEFGCYQEMLREKQEKTVQTTMTTFFKRKGQEEEEEEQWIDEPRGDGEPKEEPREGEDTESESE